MRNRLQKLTLKGFKTIRELPDFEPGALTVLIGPNGAGKSNFISFFRMLASSLGASGGLQVHVSKEGGASTLLHDGPRKTREIEAEITVATDAGESPYAFRLAYAADDTLIFAEERRRYRLGAGSIQWTEGGHREPRLISKAEEGDRPDKAILDMLRKLVVYQFHDTSPTARMRGKWDRDDNRRLKEDAANIAPFLLRLRESESKYYQRIVENIRLILDFFDDFELEAENGRLLLKWRERESDRVFSASQAADGMLRLICLVTLLLQPESNLPDVLILDEPELGLHPYAINVVAGLIRSVSTKTQVIIATQSAALLDCFEPKDVVVVERRGRESVFRRLNEDSLQEWLKNYSLSELWEKNVIGGRPS